MTLKARTTIYNGIQMRSRLEAAYAQRLDHHNLEWVYEPAAYASESGQYLPDFYIDQFKEYIEIKPPHADFDEVLERMHIILSSVPDAKLTIRTRPWEGDFKLAAFCLPNYPCGHCDRFRTCEKCPSRDIRMLPRRSEPWGHYQDYECRDCGWMVTFPRTAAPTT